MDGQIDPHVVRGSGRQRDHAPLRPLERFEIGKIDPRLEPGDVAIRFGLRAFPDGEAGQVADVVFEADAAVACRVVQEDHRFLVSIADQVGEIALLRVVMRRA